MKPTPMVPNSHPDNYTAAHLASYLGMSKRGVRLALSKISPGKKTVAGQLADAWPLSALPLPLQERLQRLSEKSGCRNVSEMLAAPIKCWQPAIPLNEVAQHCLDKAVKLQRALATALARRNDLMVSCTENETLGLEEYRHEIGFPISSRQWRRLFNRTIDRAGVGEDFGRLELYLDERPAVKAAAPSRPRPGDEVEFAELREVLNSFKKSDTPTAAEIQYLWLRSFEIYEAQIEDGRTPKRTQRAIVRFLFSKTPSLAKHEAALRKMFKRKLACWLKNDRRIESLADKRVDKSGFHRAPELKSEDTDALIAHTVLNCDGRVSQAWRELSQRGALSEDLLGHYLHGPASKSYCPARIREAVKHEAGMMADIHHGPRQDKLNGAHIIRDWSGVSALDWICGDDATLEIYWYTEDGKGGFTLMRGQFLVFICARTLRVLQFALQPERNYNARVIKTAIVKLCDEHGLPHKGFYFERGVWYNSRILKGDASADPVSWPEAELGLRSLGLRFVHSRLPRSKPIERVIGALQDLCEGEPGYVGPDEKREKFERVQRSKLLVERGEVHPSEHFYSLDQWVVRLEEICANYNATKQDGKMTLALSPDEAFQQFQRLGDPPIKLPANCRYLLAHHKRPLRVSNNGITLRFGKQVYNYRNEETGRLRGQTVLAWFNPETPEILSVTDMNRKNAFCVERTQEVPAMDAPADLLKQELERINAHMSYARVRYRTLKASFIAPFRRTIADKKTVALGDDIAEHQTEFEERRADQQKRQTRVSRSARDLGISPGLVDDSERSESGIDQMAEAKREHARDSAGGES